MSKGGARQVVKHALQPDLFTAKFYGVAALQCPANSSKGFFHSGCLWGNGAHVLKIGRGGLGRSIGGYPETIRFLNWIIRQVVYTLCGD